MRLKRWIRLAGIVLILVILVQMAGCLFPDRQHKARLSLHQAVKDAFPDAARNLEARYGINGFEGNTADSPDQALQGVILIHGLDDPGLVWRNLAPALAENGYWVWIMTYPNDQAIQASSRLFLDQLKKLTQKTSRPVAVVSHSMGGIVTRDLLTNPAYGYAEQAGQGLVPRIDRFIMIAPPNHGSQLARFRILTELRDQAIHLTRKETHWLHGLLDGTGVAGIELLPGSRFLTELNRRPLLKNMDIHIIAGLISPWAPDEIQEKTAAFAESLPSLLRTAAHTWGNVASAVAGTLGDGLVPLSSVQLSDIPVILVNGIHMPMVRNYFKGSKRIPPVVPVVLDLLASVPG